MQSIFQNLREHLSYALNQKSVAMSDLLICSKDLWLISFLWFYCIDIEVQRQFFDFYRCHTKKDTKSDNAYSMFFLKNCEQLKKICTLLNNLIVFFQSNIGLSLSVRNVLNSKTNYKNVEVHNMIIVEYNNGINFNSYLLKLCEEQNSCKLILEIFIHYGMALLSILLINHFIREFVILYHF